jgi:tRNA A37 threonylcarbamoyladenosine modification protein TsaB
VNIVIDAQREEYYLATYEITDATIQESEALHLEPALRVKERMAQGEVVVGPDLEDRLPGARMLCPDAVTLGRLAAGRNDFIPGERMEPIYLRVASYKKAPPIRVIP